MTGFIFNSFSESATGITSLFAGNVINLLLYGALTVQLYLYYTSFPQDPRLLKAIVSLIYATETVCTILLTYDLGIFAVTGGSTWKISLIVVPVGGGIVAFLTQATYAYRLRVLSRLKYVSWFIVAFVAANLVVVIVLALAIPLYSLQVAPVWASISLAIDITITGIMFWVLTKNEILSKQLKSKVTRLVHLIIGTGALTAAINLLTLILSVLKSRAVYGPAIVLSKLYANSMMVFLNDRILYGRGRDDQAVVTDIAMGPLGSIRFATATLGPADTAQEQQTLDEGCDNARSSTSGRTVVANSTAVPHEEGNGY